MDDDEYGKNPLAPAGLLLSIVGGPLGLIVSYFALRRAERTGEGRTMAVAGLTISAAWIAIAVFTLANVLNPGYPGPADADAAAQPTGTTVTVNPAVAAPPAAPPITGPALASLAADGGASAKGKVYALQGSAITEGSEIIASVRRGSVEVRVLLRGALLSDVAEDDEFAATVTVTGAEADGLPLLTVSDLDVL